MARTSSKQDRLLVTHPFRHYRRTYSMKEVRWGLVVPIALTAILAWVMWKGANPDPELHAAAPLAGGDGSTLEVTKRPAKSATARAAEHSPLPAQLAAPGWQQGPITRFTKDNLYVKINGRADYFLAFGFQQLHVTSLAHGNDGTTTIDIEAYDMGSPANALGAFTGERKVTDRPRVSGGAMAFTSRNALFLTRGKYYVRAIGSDDSAVVKQQLAHLERALVDGMNGESQLPWAYELFVKKLEYVPAKVMYMPANALSFEFGRDVYTARGDGDLLLFAVVKESDAAAGALAKQFIGGLESYGKRLPGPGPVIWVMDQYTRTLATAVATGKFVLGVRGAPDLASAKATLARLSLGLSELPAAVRDGAKPAPAPKNQPATEPDGAEPGPQSAEPGRDGAEPGSTEEM